MLSLISFNQLVLLELLKMHVESATLGVNGNTTSKDKLVFKYGLVG
jgi:hypothetical protein